MEALSTCCDAVIIGEADGNIGRCGFCFEMSEFLTVEEMV